MNIISEGYLINNDKKFFWLLVFIYTSLILFIAGCVAVIIYFTFSLETIWAAITGISTLILAAITGFYAAISYHSTSEMKKARHADFLPIIEIKYLSLEADTLRTGFTLRNIGKGPALKIQVKYCGTWMPPDRVNLAPGEETLHHISLRRSSDLQLVTVRSCDIFDNSIYSWITIKMEEGVHDLVCSSWEFGSSPEGFVE